MFNNQNQRIEERKEDKPPYSRVFVVCSKQTQEEDLRVPFEKYGVIEDLYMPKDRHTGELKGVAYIKYMKTSSAAAAIQDLQAQGLKINNKPIKVMVASSKHDSNSTNEKGYKRLFIKVHKDVTSSELHDHFSEFGYVDSIHLQKDKNTDKCKGFAYINYATFLDAAKAYEECDKKYKPVFATPKEDLKRSRRTIEGGFGPQGDYYYSGNSHQLKDFYDQKEEKLPLLNKIEGGGFNTIIVTCSPQVPQKFIEQLFNVIPGMIECQYSVDAYNGICKAVITYSCEKSAAYAVEKINKFEFPSGELVFVKPDENVINKAAKNLTNIVNSFKNSIEAGSPDLIHLAEAIAQASSIIKAATSTSKLDHKLPSAESQENFCSVHLPPPQPLAEMDSRVAQRCFIVCKPYPPPPAALRDAFCRFGNLIDVCTFPNKTFGFVKFASVKSAQEAIATLNGATLYGIHIKVLEADEKPSKDLDGNLVANDENNMAHENEIKRLKIH